MKSKEITEPRKEIGVGDLAEFIASEKRYIVLVTGFNTKKEIAGIVVWADKNSVWPVNTVFDSFGVHSFVRYNGTVQLQND